MEFLNMILSGTNQGILWGIMALGVYITFRLLDFADLTVEGSFATGGAVAAILIANKCDPLVACLVALIAGAAAGAVTGLLNTKLKIPPILAGILTMTGLYTINLLIMGNKSSVAILPTQSMFAFVEGWFKVIPRTYIILMIGLVISAIVVGASYWFFGTEIGSSIRATGANEKMCRAQGINTDSTKILGLMISNAFVAFSGALIAQQQGTGNLTMGVGAIVIGLASVVIGETIVSSKRNFMARLISIFLGSVIYRLIITIVYYLGLGTEYTKLLTAVIIVIALSLPALKGKFSANKRTKNAPANPTDVTLNDELTDVEIDKDQAQLAQAVATDNVGCETTEVVKSASQVDEKEMKEEEKNA